MKTSYVFPLALCIVACILGAVYVVTVASVPPTPTVQVSSGEVPLTPATTTSASKKPTKNPVPVPANVSTFTMAVVRVHATDASCYTAIGGKVYDVTSWIQAHPGGADAIRALCGTDGTVAFTAQHGGRSRPEAELATFLIGTLSAP